MLPPIMGCKMCDEDQKDTTSNLESTTLLTLCFQCQLPRYCAFNDSILATIAMTNEPCTH